jgi:hypothetical protein
MSSRSVLALVLGLFVAVTASCTETPSQGFEAFYAALADGSPDAYARLSTKAQAAVDVAARQKGVDPARFFASAPPKTTVRRIDVVEQSGDHATLSVVDALGNAAKVPMVRENGRWLVDAQ